MSTMNRLGSSNAYDNVLRNLQARQNSLSNLQENLTSGKKVVRASDDPTGAAQAERARNRLQRVATDQRALELQRNSIASAESTLGNVIDTLQSFRELVVSAGSGAKTALDRQTIATQLVGLRDQVVSLSNMTDTNGQPMFSGLGSALAPFVGPMTTDPTYSFDGLAGQTSSSEVAIPSTLDGDAAFMYDQARDRSYNVAVQANASATPVDRMLKTSATTVTDPSEVEIGQGYKVTITNMTLGATAATGIATYTVEGLAPNAFAPVTLTSAAFDSKIPVTIPITIPNSVSGNPALSLNITGDVRIGDSASVQPVNSIFKTLENAIEGIEGAATGNAAAQAVAQALTNIDIGLSKLSSVRGQAGDLLNRADRISSNQDKRNIQLEGDRSRAEDLDMTKGISDFQNQNTGYQAALQSYAMVQKLSLFNYIG